MTSHDRQYRQLHAQARQAIAELELVSCGATRNPDSDGRGSSDSSVYPAHGHRRVDRAARERAGGLRMLGDTEPEFLTLRRRLKRATTVDELRDIRDTAHAEREALVQQTQTDNPEPGTLQFKRMIANSPLNPTELHRLYGVSRTTVYAYRAKYRTDQDSPARHDADPVRGVCTLPVGWRTTSYEARRSSCSP